MPCLNDFPRHLRAAVVKEFEGERIVWVGRPGVARAFIASPPIPLFGIPWTAFSLGWEWMALSGWLSGKPSLSTTHTLMGVIFPLFGIPFVLVGLGMMAMPFITWRWARKTVHVLGERRMVTMTVGRRMKVKTFAASAITRTERTERRNGSGTLKIVLGSRRDSDGDKIDDVEVFTGIADVRKVERLISARLENDRRAA